MRLNEFYDPENDKGAQRTVQDTRKSRLTLEELNKLRKYRDIKNAEKLEHEEFARTMYAAPAAEGPAI